jgi:carboxyl-terminal processing protease
MRRHVLWIALCVATFAQAKPAVDSLGAPLLKATPEQGQAAILATNYWTKFHYKAIPLDSAMSGKIFDHYLNSLDAERLFFVQSDVDKFLPAREKLGEAINSQNLTVPFDIFNLYEQHVAERTAFARSLLAKGFDFSQDESYSYERDKLPWAKSQEELNDVWRKRVKNDWLRLKLAKEKDPVKDSDAGKKPASTDKTTGKDKATVATTPAKPQDIDAEIRKTLDKRYATYLDRVKKLNGEDVFQTFMNAYAMSIEPHTNYLGPRASENFDIAMKLSLEGIGAVLQANDEYTVIREIVPGGPAALSGKIKVGDRIVGVGQGENGQLTDVLGWRLDDVVEQIRGTKDTVVRLDILPVDVGPDGKHELIPIVRKKVNIEEQAAKSSVIETRDGDVVHRIGVITLPSFYQDFDAHRRGDKDYRSATKDVAKLLTELKAQKVEGVMVDLRNDGGGSLNEAADLTGLFIDKGPVVQVRNAQGKIDSEDDNTPGMTWEGPLAVLVNRNSASASEIFAAAIQDYGRGLIVGEPTYGKGTVQNLLDLDQYMHNEKPVYGELKSTIAQFFRINGGTTQLRGVTPDINVPLTGDFDENGEQAFDKQGFTSLPWTSIPPADYKPVADLKGLVPLLQTRHDARVAKDKTWSDWQEDVTEARKQRKQTTISLNETVRRKERDEQEARRKAHADDLASAMPADPATKTMEHISRDSARASKPNRILIEGVGSVVKIDDKINDAKPAKAADANTSSVLNNDGESTTPTSDDGLQADERNLKSDLAAEAKRKQAKDVLLQEAARIVSDEVTLIKNDTQLAERVLPHSPNKVEMN